MITKAHVIDSLAIAVAAFPNYSLTQSQVNAYYELLRDLDISYRDLLNAVKQECQTSEFFPTVAGIRKHLISTPTPPPYTALEAPKGIPMPDHVRELLHNAFKTPEDSI